MASYTSHVNQQFKDAVFYRLTEKGDTKPNPAWTTPWTLVHFSTGIVAHAVVVHFKLNLWLGFLVFNLIHLLYEVKDQTRARAKNSMPNSVGDQIAASLGYIFAIYVLRNNNTPIVALLFLISSYVLIASIGATPIFEVQFW
jgi:hypothetical protein